MTTIPELLQACELLEHVSEEAIASLGARAEMLELPVGKPFQRAGFLPSGPAMVVKGRLRRVVMAPGAKPVSFGSIKAGEWVGWASVLRGEPDFTLTASEHTILLRIPFRDALDAVRKHQSLRDVFNSPLTEEIIELSLLLLAQADQDPGAELQNKLDQINGAWTLLQPGSAPPQDAAILLSGPRPADLNLQPGALIDVQSWSSMPAQVNGLPVRFLTLPEDKKRQLLDLPQEPVETQRGGELALRPEQRPVAISETGELVDPEELGFHRGWRNELVDQPTAFGADPSLERLEQAVACVRHLAEARKLAFSVDLVRRNLSDAEHRLGQLNLAQIGLQLEALGFETRPLRVRAHELTRLEPPALLDLDGAFVLLLVAGGGGGVLVGDPRHGLRRWTLQRLQERLEDGVELLVVREGRTERQPGEEFGLSWFVSSFLRYPGLLTMTLVTAFTSQLLSAVFPLGVLSVIDQVIGQNNSSLLAPLVAILVVAALAGGITGSMRALVSADLSDRVDVRLGASVVEHLLRLPVPYFERRQVGGILFNVNQLYNVRQFIVDQLLGAGLDAIFAIFFLIVILLISPILALVVVAVVPILAGINAISSPLLTRLIKQSNRFNAAANAFLYEVVSGVRTVKSQNFEVEARWQWLERYRKYTASRFQLTRLASLTGQGANLISNLSSVILIAVGASLILADQLSVGALFAVKILSDKVVSPMLRLSNLYRGFQEMRLATECLADVMLAVPEVGREDLQAIPLTNVQGAVRFEDVCFRYGSRGPLVLDHINLSIESGQFVGLVGLSGSGKSTLVQLLDRLYLPKEGVVFLDDLDVQKLQIATLRRQIGYVPQESLLFQGSVLDNIRMNSPQADIEAVMDAARVAAAHDFILGLENGYATELGERGAGLSGGQRQRLCLARTVLQNPGLLILDEATSALDAETEQLVCRNLANRFRNTTVLFITHRLTTLRNADRILFMEKGRICEDGNHTDLMDLGGAYATLYNQQVQAGV